MKKGSHKEAMVTINHKPSAKVAAKAYTATKKLSTVEEPAVDIVPGLSSYGYIDDKNMFSIIDVVRNGISYKEFDKLITNTPFTIAEWANYLQLSERTIQRNQKEKKSFQPIQSERIVELSMLHNYGVDVFGDKDNFNIWLNSKSISLSGRKPKELLDTKFGVDMVRDELTRIEHGVLA